MWGRRTRLSRGAKQGEKNRSCRGDRQWFLTDSSISEDSQPLLFGVKPSLRMSESQSCWVGGDYRAQLLCFTENKNVSLEMLQTHRGSWRWEHGLLHWGGCWLRWPLNPFQLMSLCPPKQLKIQAERQRIMVAKNIGFALRTGVRSWLHHTPAGDTGLPDTYLPCIYLTSLCTKWDQYLYYLRGLLWGFNERIKVTYYYLHPDPTPDT